MPLFNIYLFVHVKLSKLNYNFTHTRTIYVFEIAIVQTKQYFKNIFHSYLPNFL